MRCNFASPRASDDWLYAWSIGSLDFDKALLAPQAATIAGEAAIGADDAMAGDQQGDQFFSIAEHCPARLSSPSPSQIALSLSTETPSFA